MPLVKPVWVRFGVQGADAVKTQMATIAARAQAIGKMDPAIKVSVSDKAALLQLAALRVELRAAGKDSAALGDIAVRLKQIGDTADAPRVKMAALALEMRALQGAINGGGGGGGRGGLLGAITSLFGAGGGTAAGGAAAGAGGIGTGGAIGIGAGALAALSTGLLGIIPAAVAAGAGLLSFGDRKSTRLNSSH
jgi:hypothetical protein